MKSGSVPARWFEYKRQWESVESELIQESRVTLYVNGHELVTITCTPTQLEALALGFMKNEGVIDGIEEVEILHVAGMRCCVDAWLTKPAPEPKRIVITSGCGGGVTFDDPSVGIDPLEDDVRLKPERLADFLTQLHYPGSLHTRARGVHAAGLSDTSGVLLVAEDIGRHNTIDKLLGACMQKDIETRGLILLATGRVSSEMIHKAARMGCPIVASRNSPTSMSVAMADAWNITLAGYVRRNSMRVYTHPSRLGHQEPKTLHVGDLGVPSGTPDEGRGRQ